MKKSIQEQIDAAYKKKGASGVYDLANKLNLSYRPCDPCAAETPIHEGKCAVCGTVSRGKKYYSIRVFYAKSDRDAQQLLEGDAANFSETDELSDKVLTREQLLAALLPPKTYYLFGHAASRVYYDVGMNGKDGLVAWIKGGEDVWDVFEYDPATTTPGEFAEAMDGWEGYATIEEKEYKRIQNIKHK